MSGKRVAGRHFLQIPGPTNVPDRILRAIDRPTIDHRGPAFQEMAKDVLERLRHVFKTEGPVVIFPASGTGAWEAALVNTLSPGDVVLMYETGHFASLWYDLAKRLGLEPQLIPGDWRSGADPERIGAILEADRDYTIKAVAVVHNETSTGAASRIRGVRKAIDDAGHPALLMVDTISSLASIDYRHDDWGVDVTVGGSQKGLMLPPGLSFNAVGEKALKFAEKADLPRSYWDWRPMLAANADGFFPYTPATNLHYGLQAALDMLFEEGLDAVFARHARHGAATRAAVEAWGLEVLCQVPEEYSGSLTAVMTPDWLDADELRAEILKRYDLSLGNGLSKLQGKVFRIGHLGDFNDLMLAGTLSGVEMGLRAKGMNLKASGVGAALELLGHA
jgi:alanine-glyoxylate transaminase/serine-glyoxylate transaminase/serine-pyruvate transaminase